MAFPSFDIYRDQMVQSNQRAQARFNSTKTQQIALASELREAITQVRRNIASVKSGDLRAPKHKISINQHRKFRMSPQRYQLSLDKKRLDQTISELIKLRTQFQNNKDYLETWPRFLINTNKQLQLLDERSMRFSQIFLSDQWKELFDWTFITEINGEQFDLLLIEIENLHRDAVQIQQMTPRNDESIQYIINQHVEYWHSKQDRMPDAGIESEHQAKRIRGLAEIQTNTNALVSAWEKFIAGYSNLPQAH